MRSHAYPSHAAIGCEGAACHCRCCRPHAPAFPAGLAVSTLYRRPLQGFLQMILTRHKPSRPGLAFSLSLNQRWLTFCMFQVLGLREGADSESVQRQYNKLKREKKGNESAISAIENAHSALMMRNLTSRMQASSCSHCMVAHTAFNLSLHPLTWCSRCAYLNMQGGVSVAKDIKYADKAQYLPWRPR